MKYKINHDIHIHSKLSICSCDESQDKFAILDYAEKSDYDYICITDHCWSSDIPCHLDFFNNNLGWHKLNRNVIQNIEHVSSIKPLPQGKNVKFYFGCETDLDDTRVLGLRKEDFDKFDFVNVSVDHLHMYPFVSVEENIKEYVDKIDKVLDMDLPFHKIGLAHLTIHYLAPKGDWIKVSKGVSDEMYEKLFTKAAKVGVGIELNAYEFDKNICSDEEIEQSLKVFGIAKRCGCKFYLGSDTHFPKDFARALPSFTLAVERLGFTEDDKFNPFN